MNFREITPADFDIVSPIFQNSGMETGSTVFRRFWFGLTDMTSKLP